LTPRRENHPRASSFLDQLNAEGNDTASFMLAIQQHACLTYRVAQNKIPHRCNISTTNGLILKILEAA